MPDHISNKNYYVKEIPAKDARDIVKKYHYSHKVVSNSKLHLGVFNLDNKLCGCLQFGLPMNGLKTMRKLGCGDQMLELNRMVMTDEEPRNAESQAISLAIKYLKKNTELKYILSFSDGKESNVGYIYQATNWKYIGFMISDSFYDCDGDIIHSVTAWHRYKEKHELRDTHTTHEIMCNYFHNISKITSKQHIYIFDIQKNITFKFPSFPYPKIDTEVPILKRKWIKKNGKICKDTELYCDFNRLDAVI